MRSEVKRFGTIVRGILSKICWGAGQWTCETGLYVDDGAAVRKLRKRHAVKLADTTEKKQDGHPYLKILPDWFEEC